MNRSGFATIVAICFSAVLSSCSKGEKSHTVPSAADPLIELIRTDIQTPIQFALHAPLFFINDHGQLSSWAGQLVRGSYTLTDWRHHGWNCGPSDFEFKYAPATEFLAGEVLLQLVGHGIEKRTDWADNYMLDAMLSRTETMWFTDCGVRWQLYNLGHFTLLDAKLLNAFDGPDKQTGSTTKIRSYSVKAAFTPQPSLVAIAPEVNYGHYEWTVAFEKNPITAEWVLYQSGQITWFP